MVSATLGVLRPMQSYLAPNSGTGVRYFRKRTSMQTCAEGFSTLGQDE